MLITSNKLIFKKYKKKNKKINIKLVILNVDNEKNN